MSKYRVTGTLSISVHTDVDAPNEEEAKSLALGRSVLTLCPECSRGEPDSEWVTTSGELDGVPYDLDAVES